jgi:hypothetical protein
MNRKTYKAYLFFKEQAGYVVGRGAIGAYKRVKAEQIAEERGWEVMWEPDEDGDLGDHTYWCANARKVQAKEQGRPVDGRVRECDHFSEYAYLVDGDGNRLGPALGGILDASEDDRREIAAELALEAIGEERAQVKEQRLAKAAPDLLKTLIQGIEASGFSVSGPTDVRAAEHGEPAWICNAREIIAKATQG